jgi:hypothetical protein
MNAQRYQTRFLLHEPYRVQLSPVAATEASGKSAIGI